MKIRTIAIALVLAFSVSAFARSGDLFDELKERQGEINTIKAEFSQEKHTKFLKKPILSSGTLWYSAPNRVRWEYNGAMIAVFDGEALYLYYEGRKEAEKIKTPGGVSLPTGFDLKEMEKYYDITAKGEKGGIEVTLVPKKKSSVASITMHFAKDEKFPGKMRIDETTGDFSVIDFKKIDLNSSLKESVFEFVPPKGVTVKERGMP